MNVHSRSVNRPALGRLRDDNACATAWLIAPMIAAPATSGSTFPEI